MMNSNSTARYRPRIVPELHELQEADGYLRREKLEQLSIKLNEPLYRLQAVASFFPHFRVEKPPAVTVRICRDTACHLAGADNLIKELSTLQNDNVAIEGTSCLGRCDRCPAACIAVHHEGAGNSHATGEQELYYHGKTPEQFKQIIAMCAQGKPPPQDLDAGMKKYPSPTWMIDPYKGAAPTYEGVKKALAARTASIAKAAEILQAQKKWTRERAEMFRTAAESKLQVSFTLDREIVDAVRDWQTASNWAKGKEIGDWADVILDELDAAKADLRGLGGAGIPATQKWRDVREAVRNARRRKMDDRAFIVVNGDESEPATFKDREILLHVPWVVVEGVVLAGLLTEASEGFIYIRHEYPEQIASCRAEIERYIKEFAKSFTYRTTSGEQSPFPVSVFISPGGYICGEQSALIEAMSDRRAEPRNMPPKLETNGLDDQPTLVSNVETFGWTPYIWIKGGQAYADLGTNGWRGRRFFSVCGDIQRPGVYEVPMGMTLGELLTGNDFCQGIAGGKKLKAFAPSGPSGGFIPAKLTIAKGLPRKHKENKTWLEMCKRRNLDPNADELDILNMELELNFFRAISPTQALGAGLIVYAEGRNMCDQAINAIQFFRNESCGKCVPCRIGSQKLAGLGNHLLNREITKQKWDNELLPILKDMTEVLSLTSICGLGRSVPVPLRTVIDFFPEDLAVYLSGEKGK
jgi:formate dehydrogenase beta subunit